MFSFNYGTIRLQGVDEFGNTILVGGQEEDIQVEWFQAGATQRPVSLDNVYTGASGRYDVTYQTPGILGPWDFYIYVITPRGKIATDRSPYAINVRAAEVCAANSAVEALAGCEYYPTLANITIKGRDCSETKNPVSNAEFRCNVKQGGVTLLSDVAGVPSNSVAGDYVVSFPELTIKGTYQYECYAIQSDGAALVGRLGQRRRLPHLRGPVVQERVDPPPRVPARAEGVV